MVLNTGGIEDKSCRAAAYEAEDRRQAAAA